MNKSIKIHFLSFGINFFLVIFPISIYIQAVFIIMKETVNNSINEIEKVKEKSK